MTKEQVMRDWIIRQVGCGYIYGATGWVCTEARRKQQAEQYPAYADVIMTTGAKWDGKVCYDCAQLTRRAMEQIGLKPPSGATSQYKRIDLYSQAGSIGQLPPGRLAQLFRVVADETVPHTGWAIGDGTTVDARGHKEGVVRMDIGKYPWTHYKVIAGSEDEFIGDTPKIAGTPEAITGLALILQPVRMRKSTDTSSSANVIRQMGIGETAEVIAVTKKGNETWAHVQQEMMFKREDKKLVPVTYRGWACVEDAKTRYIQLPDTLPPTHLQPEKLYIATITALSIDQVNELIRQWPQALIRDLT